MDIFPARLGSGDAPFEVRGEASGFRVTHAGRLLLTAELRSEVLQVAVSTETVRDTVSDEAKFALGALLERLFALPDGPVRLHLEVPPLLAGCLVVEHGVQPSSQGLIIEAGQFFQAPRPWLAHADRPAFPLHYVFTGQLRHPQRPPKPRGTVYTRWIPWLSGAFSLRSLEGEADLALLHRWLNDPRVDAFWNEAGSLDRHRAYLDGLAADPHMLPLFGCIDGRAFCYFELYWAKENRLGPYYESWDWDRGWHVLVGDESCRGRPWVTAWLPSLMHYIFLDDPRTQRIVGEPRVDHIGQLRNLDRAGFGRIKEIVLPHKRVVLVRLEREHFFADRLWAPASA